MSGLIELIQAQRWALFRATAAHLDLVVEAIGIACLIGIPLGVFAARSRPLERVAVGLANVLQTIPSLALLGFLLILFGGIIGKPPALAALVVYSLLPILRNTILGLRGIDPGVREAALGMGMTAWQRLRLVELPLAMPSILGGVKVATVAAVGMATIAAAIGAEGLGRFIFRGVSLSDTNLILLGSVPAALLALACDAALGELERGLDPVQPRVSNTRLAASIVGTLALLSLAGWGFVNQIVSRQGSSGTVVIGSKDSSEPILLAHMLKQLVEAETPYRVVLKPNLGGTLVCYNALVGGGLDAYVEYTGTALTTILKKPPRNDPAAVLDEIRKGFESNGVEVLPPLGYENTFAILMRREQSGRLGVSSISDLARVDDLLRFGAGPEFMNRPDGFPGLVGAYGLHFTRTPIEMDRNLLYQALARESIDVAAGDSTDGRIDQFDLVVLEDDGRYFPPYDAVTLVRRDTLRTRPGLEDALNRIAGVIDEPTMRRLNRAIDLEKRSPPEVAREFLVKAGLLKE